jgi:hypothetical protein
MTNIQELQLLLSSEGEGDDLQSFASFFQINPLPLLDRLFVNVKLCLFAAAHPPNLHVRRFKRILLFLNRDILLCETRSSPATLPMQATRRQHWPARSSTTQEW